MDTDAEFQKAAIEAVLEYGIDIAGRRIFLHGGVDEETIGLAIRGLYMLGDMMPKEPVELYVSSYGGELDEAFALHDVTRTVTCPVTTVALGKCMSAAPMLVACGKKGHRFATENTMFMLHDATMTDMSDARPVEVATYVSLTEAMMERYARLLARYTKKGVAHWRKIFSGKADTVFGVEEALDWGVIDSIWSEKG